MAPSVRMVDPGSIDGLGELELIAGVGLLGDLEPDPAQAVRAPAFHGHDHRHLVAGTAWPAGASAPDEGLVEFDDPAEHLAVGTHHRAAQLLHPRPRRLIRPEAQRTLQPERRHTVLLRGHEPHRGEPRRDRRMRTVKDRARGHRRLAPAVRAHPTQRRRAPRVLPETHRADEPVRPAQLTEVLDTRAVIAKPVPKLLIGARVVNPTHRPTAIPRSETTALKQICRTCVPQSSRASPRTARHAHAPRSSPPSPTHPA